MEIEEEKEFYGLFRMILEEAGTTLGGCPWKDQ
jgi:hypothetical protein